MDHAPTTLLFFFVACYCSSNEYFVAGGVASGSEQPLENQMSTMVNDSNSASLSSVQPRIVTDIHSGGRRLAEVSEDKNTNEVVSCNLLGEQTLIKLVLAVIPAAQVTNVSTEEMNQLVNTCMNIQQMTSGSSILDTLGDTLHSLVIFPGTKWCGPGNVAENDNDLGQAAATDRCCRNHDKSASSIAPFETEHNVTNYRPYPMTDCANDRTLYDCLLKVKIATSSSYPCPSTLCTAGTKWYGPGNVAENDNDLGQAAATDRCCRNHDKSASSIAPFETEHNVTNYRPYPMTDCESDRTLYDCLQKIQSPTSVAFGTIFFDVLRPQCFEYDYPTKCTEYNLLLLLLLRPPCEEFEPDTSKPKEWHVVDDPSFLLGLLEKE
ncbi:uncharacterized protein LOC144095188 [Amblyomma americanum]